MTHGTSASQVATQMTYYNDWAGVAWGRLRTVRSIGNQAANQYIHFSIRTAYIGTNIQPEGFLILFLKQGLAI